MQIYTKSNDLQINNLYKNDKSLNPQTTDSSNTKNVLNNLNKSQKPTQNTDSSNIKNVFNDLNKSQKPQTSQVTDKIGAALPQSDTFFNKFMKVMLPTSQQ